MIAFKTPESTTKKLLRTILQHPVPTEILILILKTNIAIELVHTDGDKSLIVGYQLWLEGRRSGSRVRSKPVVANRLYRPLRLGDCKPEDLEIKCRPINGIPAWDGKAGCIVGGRGSCSVLCPCSCCTRTRSDLGRAPEYLQREIIADMIRSCFGEHNAIYDGYPCTNPDGSEYGFARDDFPEPLKEKIAEYADRKIFPDAPKRRGKLKSTKAAATWKHLTSAGRMGLTATDYEEANKETGSTFFDPIVDASWDKCTEGWLHITAGLIAHFNKQCKNAICDFRKDSPWRQRAEAFRERLERYRAELEDNAPLEDQDSELKREVSNMRGRLTRARKKLEKLEEIPMPIPEEIEKLETAQQAVDELIEQLEEAKEQRREHAMLSKSGTYRLLQCGADHLAEGVEEGLREGSSLPKEDMQYAYQRFLETRAGGRLINDGLVSR